MFRGLLGRNCIVVAASLLCCGAVLAADAKGATAVGEATASVTLQPTILRVQVPIFGVGKTVAAALEKLKDHRATAVQKLKSLGAIADSIVVGKTTVNSTRGPSTYNAPGFAPPGYPPPPPSAPQPDASGPSASVIVPPVAPPPNAYAAPAGAADWAVVSATVSADCPLEADGPDCAAAEGRET